MKSILLIIFLLAFASCQERYMDSDRHKLIDSLIVSLDTFNNSFRNILIVVNDKTNYDSLCVLGKRYKICGIKMDENNPFEERSIQNVTITDKKDGFVKYVRTFEYKRKDAISFSRSCKDFIDETKACK